MMNKYWKLMCLIFLLTISGCAGMADSMNQMVGIGVISTEESTFDGTKTIRVSPNWLYEAKGTFSYNSIKLGAHWSDAEPNYIALDLSYESDTSGYSPIYIGITGIEVNIDGKKSKYASNTQTSLDSSGYNTVSRTIYTKSVNSVVIPFTVLEDMVNATDTRLRIHTNKGYEDSRFSIERSSGGQGTALLSLREFLDRVRAER